MKKILLFLNAIILLTHSALAQSSSDDKAWENIYRNFSKKSNNMVHTKLDARFDYKKCQLNGKVWLTFTPHFYATDSLQLDAKGMDIRHIQLIDEGKNIPLNYTYDSLKLNIGLGKKYSAGEKYTVNIEYTAKPNEYSGNGSMAISGVKGLYFINPDGQDKDKPTQIWTQGETESNSVWIPMIDKPNQKSTQEMILTVPDKYVTLSNGSLVEQKNNKDGTRTDTWKMDLPHAPYLFFIGVGDYAVVKDLYEGKEVSYYVEKPFKDLARRIFGDTPEMITFFSQKLGVDYPWEKYAQMTAADFVSGAMENTTATLHNNMSLQNARELTDGNRWETIIAHELFHHWFGDLVTCESWSNITVNESFADFSQGMWIEHRYGKDDGEAEYFNGLRTFLVTKHDSAKALVRYHYANKEDVFDRVSYQKGGAILNMLKNFVGEDAFFQSLNIYLTKNRFGTGNAHKVQQAFEDITGKDLNWFFNQWYYSAGYPELDISYDFDRQNNKALVYVAQKQKAKLFRLPVKIDVYEGSNVTQYSKWIENTTDTFSFNVTHKPDLINVDAYKILVANKTDHKTLAQYIFQYQNAKNYVDRWEAIDYAEKHLKKNGAVEFLNTTLTDPNYRLRIKTLQAIQSLELDKDMLAKITEMVMSDPKKIVAAQAINVLGGQNDKKYKRLFVNCLDDSSYSVAGAAYLALIDIDERTALSWLPKLKTDAHLQLEVAVKKAEILTKTDADFNEMYTWISDLDIVGKFRGLTNFIFYLGSVNDTTSFKKGIEKVIEIRDELTKYAPPFGDTIRKELVKLKKTKEEEIKKVKGQLENGQNYQIKLLDKFLTKELVEI